MINSFKINLKKARIKVLLYFWNLLDNLQKENSSVISELNLYIGFSKFCDAYLIYPY
jgi:hypothetical protein